MTTQYGSLVNMMMADTAQPEPRIGDGATILHWSDRHACTVVDVIRFKTGTRAGEVKGVVVQRDKATRTDGNGMSECQEYAYEADTDAAKRVFTKRKDGSFRDADGTAIGLGYRREYHDYSF